MDARWILPVWGIVAGAMVGCASQAVTTAADQEVRPPSVVWDRGPLSDPDFFPIMVWAQDPALAPQYKALGVNTYMALWQGPTDAQLAQLREHGMYAICAQNEVGLAHLDDPTILAWMHGDEPDNHKPSHDGPVPLEPLLADYVKMITADRTRPVVVNFGQGVANEDFRGRALDYDRYPLYAHAADIVSYDVYPVANLKYSAVAADGSRSTDMRDDGADYLWYVARGIDRLARWTGGSKPVWNVLECTAISHPDGHKVTPHQLRAEVWMSLIHGSTGLCWFVHDFRPDHRDAAALLSDPEMMEAVAQANHQVLGLAPVLNSPTHTGVAEAISTDPEVPVDIMVKRHDGALYVFAVCMRNAPTDATFLVRGLPRRAEVEVLDEQRTLTARGGEFADHFEPYDVHLYRIALP